MYYNQQRNVGNMAYQNPYYSHQNSSDMDGVDKVLCVDRCGNNGNGLDSLAAASILNGGWNNRGMYGMEAFANNQMWNNPFAYMLMLGMMRMMWGDNWQNNPQACNQYQTLSEQIANNQNSSLIMGAIQGNLGAIRELATSVNCGFNTMQQCCCQIQAAIQQVAGQVGFSAERVINAVNMGDCNIIQALKDCCCTTQKMILEQGYQNQLAQKDQMFATQKGFCDLTFATQAGFDRTNTALERGFSSTAFQAQQDKCDLIRAGENNTQRIVDTLNSHWKDEQALQIQDLKFQLSQERQNRYFAGLLNRNNDGCGCNSGCGNGCGNGWGW